MGSTQDSVERAADREALEGISRRCVRAAVFSSLVLAGTFYTAAKVVANAYDRRTDAIEQQTVEIKAASKLCTP